MDRELYQKLVSATKYCQVCKEAREVIQAKEQAIRAFEQRHTEQLGSFMRPLMKIFLFGGLIFISSMIFLIVGIAMLANGETFDGFVIVPFMVIFSLMLLAIGIIRFKKNDTKTTHIYESEIKPKVEEGLEEIKKIQAGAEKYAADYKHLLDFLPAKYRNLEATSFMLMTVTDQRADTLKEAMNLYEEQLHRWKLENIALQNAEMQQYLADALDELNSQQAEANAHLSAIRQMQFIEYLHPKS